VVMAEHKSSADAPQPKISVAQLPFSDTNLHSPNLCHFSLLKRRLTE
jgi:hypothetical protein